MAHVVKTIRLSKLDTLPGTSMSPGEMQCDGAIVVMRDDGSISVAVWVASTTNPDRPSIRYSYKIDAQGNYILGSARYSRQTLEDLLRGMNTPPAQPDV